MSLKSGCGRLSGLCEDECNEEMELHVATRSRLNFCVMPCGRCLGANEPRFLPHIKQMLLGEGCPHVIDYRCRMEIMGVREVEDRREIVAEGLLQRGHDTLLVEPRTGACGRGKQAQWLASECAEPALTF